ncbi:reverse transcriptase domain-containing protein [Tanacetum coccineum]
MEAFIGGLPQSIEGNVTASKPQNLEEAINIAQRLMDQILKHNSVQEANDRKRKFEDRRNTINNNNYANNSYNGDNYNHPNNHNDNRNHDHHPQQNGRRETLRTYAVSPTKYTRPHIGPCTIKCQNCNRIGHLTRNCTIIMKNIYGKQYYHGEQLNASLMVSGLRCYTPVIGKITVVILVRDRCPCGKVVVVVVIGVVIVVAIIEELRLCSRNVSINALGSPEMKASKGS